MAADREHLGKLRDLYKDAAAAVEASDAGHYKTTHRFVPADQTYFALSDEFKAKIGAKEPADWSKVTFPDRHDIATLSDEAKQLDGVKRKLRAAQDEAAKVQGLRAKLESARDRLEKAKQTLPSGDPAAVREEFAKKQSEETSVTATIKATKKEIDATDAEEKRQSHELGNIDRDLTEITGKLNLEEASRKQSAESVERAKKTLPAEWQKLVEAAGLSERAKWQDEFDALTANETEKKFTDLQAARNGLDSLRAEISQFEKRGECVPSGNLQRPPDEVKAETLAARGTRHAAAKSCSMRSEASARTRVASASKRGEELGTRYKAIDADFNRYKLLAELLGRDRLQRLLVRTAEKQIVDYANGVLDRLSGGQLFLKLVGTDDGTDKALELECANTVAGVDRRSTWRS